MALLARIYFNAVFGALGGLLGWMLFGVFGDKTDERYLPQMLLGGAFIGGAIGGFVGGCLFQLFYDMSRESLSTTYFWNATGLVILGACIGSLSALVQGVFQPASVKVMRGWQEGREYALLKPDNSLGRDEHADIALFRDMRVEKRHAVIQREGQRYILLNNESPADATLVNGRPVAHTCDLRDGDRIQLGNVILRFQLRAARNRHKAAR